MDMHMMCCTSWIVQWMPKPCKASFLTASSRQLLQDIKLLRRTLHTLQAKADSSMPFEKPSLLRLQLPANSRVTRLKLNLVTPPREGKQACHASSSD